LGFDILIKTELQKEVFNNSLTHPRVMIYV